MPTDYFRTVLPHSATTHTKHAVANMARTMKKIRKRPSMATQSRSGPSGATPTDIIRALKLEVSAQKLLVVQERAAAEIAKTEAEAAKAEAEAAKASAAAAIEQSRTEQRQDRDCLSLRAR